MAKEHKPLRTCLVCGKKKEKKTLIRFSRQADGTLLRDFKQRAPGRGHYVCDHPLCLAGLERRRKKSR